MYEGRSQLLIWKNTSLLRRKLFGYFFVSSTIHTIELEWPRPLNSAFEM